MEFFTRKESDEELETLKQSGSDFTDGHAINDCEPHVFGCSTEDHHEDYEPSRAARFKNIEDKVLSEEEAPWAKLLIGVSGMDLVISSTVMIVSLRFALNDYGVSLYCVSIQALSHMISSILLIIRFFGDLWPSKSQDIDVAVAEHAASDECLLKERRKNDLKRERDLSVFMSAVMLISSIGLFTKAMRKAYYWDRWFEDHHHFDEELEYAQKFLSIYGFLIYTWTALVRLISAVQLQKAIVWHALGGSIVSLLFCLIIGISEVTEKEWSWKAEPIAAVVLALATLVEATRVMYTHSYDVSALLVGDTWRMA